MLQVPVISLDVLLDVHPDIVRDVPFFPVQIREHPTCPQLISTHIYHHTTHLLMLPQKRHGPTNVQTDTMLTSTTMVIFKVNCRTDCVSTCGGVQVVKVVVVWVFDADGSSSVLSQSSPARFLHFYNCHQHPLRRFR